MTWKNRMTGARYSPHSGGDPQMANITSELQEYSPHSGGDPGAIQNFPFM